VSCLGEKEGPSDRESGRRDALALSTDDRHALFTSGQRRMDGFANLSELGLHSVILQCTTDLVLYYSKC
jgi:hypothetical protein